MHTGTGNEQFFSNLALPPCFNRSYGVMVLPLAAGGEVVHVQWDIPSSQFTQLWNQSIPDGASALIRNPSASQTIEVAGTPLVLKQNRRIHRRNPRGKSLTNQAVLTASHDMGR